MVKWPDHPHLRGMKRRHFLSLIGAASAAPLVPVAGSAAPAATVVGYNRYMYGLAVFHARTRASVSAADLIGKLRVSSATANAMLSEMRAKGVLVSSLKAGAGTMRAARPNGQAGDQLAKIAKKVADRVLDDGTAPVAPVDQDAEDAGRPS